MSFSAACSSRARLLCSFTFLISNLTGCGDASSPGGGGDDDSKKKHEQEERRSEMQNAERAERPHGNKTRH
jgi:hypothetical protein